MKKHKKRTLKVENRYISLLDEDLDGVLYTGQSEFAKVSYGKV